MAGKIYQAREPFLADVNGVQMAIQPRTTVREGHPLLAGREHLFDPFTVDFEYDPPASKAGGEPKSTEPPSGGPAAKPAPQRRQAREGNG